MFMCDNCNSKEKDCSGVHFSRSYGRCEVCKKISSCFYYKCYKSIPLNKITVDKDVRIKELEAEVAKLKKELSRSKYD